MRGWWRLEFTGVVELTDSDREHIAELISEGFTAGQIIQEEEDNGSQSTTTLGKTE